MGKKDRRTEDFEGRKNGEGKDRSPLIFVYSERHYGNSLDRGFAIRVLSRDGAEIAWAIYRSDGSPYRTKDKHGAEAPGIYGSLADQFIGEYAKNGEFPATLRVNGTRFFLEDSSLPKKKNMDFGLKKDDDDDDDDYDDDDEDDDSDKYTKYDKKDRRGGGSGAVAVKA